MTQVEYITIMSFLSFVILFGLVLFILLKFRSNYINKQDLPLDQQWREEQRPYIKEHKTYGKAPHKGPYNRKGSYRPGRNPNTNVQRPKD